MTSAQHTAQRDLVAGSLLADDGRETHRSVYPVRSPYAGRSAVRTVRYRPRLFMAAARVYANARTWQRWS